MPTEGRGTLFQRPDGKYLIYIPLSLCTDSQFPFTDDLVPNPSGVKSFHVKISFKPNERKLTIEKWNK